MSALALTGAIGVRAGVVAAQPAALAGALAASVDRPSTDADAASAGRALYTSITPIQLVGGASATALADERSLTVQVAGRPGVAQTGIGRAVFSVTLLEPTAAGHVQVGEAAVSFAAFEPVTRQVSTPLNAEGSITLTDSGASVGLFVDLVGWFRPSAEAASGVAERAAALAPAALGSHAVTSMLEEYAVSGVGDIPRRGVGAVVLEVTGTSPTAGSATVFPTGGAAPATRDLIVAANGRATNTVIARVGDNGRVSVARSTAELAVGVKAVGWYPLAANQRDSNVVMITPERVRLEVGSDGSAEARIIAGEVPTVGTTVMTAKGNLPYIGLVLRVEGDSIVVYAVAHQMRRPGYWRKRLTR